MTKLAWKLNEVCFWNGKRWTVEGFGDRGTVLLFPVTSPGMFVAEASQVGISEIQEPAEDLFELGDSVRTAYTFTGTVVGFEPKTNRVVCLSSKTDKYTEQEDKRKRWSYLPHELVKVPPALMQMPKLNGVYKMSSPQHRTGTLVRVLESYTADTRNLYDLETGKLVCCIASSATLLDLQNANDMKLEPVIPA